MSIREGRFEEGLDPRIARLGESISYDHRLFAEDIEGSRAHASMLHKIGLLEKSELQQILDGLETIEQDIAKGNFSFDPDLEDIHMNVESALKHRIGEVAGKLHTGRSRNDQVATDERLYLRKSGNALIKQIEDLIRSLLHRAETETETLMPAYTHLQRGQPTTLGHHLHAYSCMLLRDRDRFRDCIQRSDVLPLGSGACVGSGLPLDREFVREQLGFSSLSSNSLDAVSDRDHLLEFLSSASILAVHLSRLSEELVLWSSAEFGFVILPDSISTGSSMMPQKKNPDGAELIRGKTGRIFGHLISLLTVMKGLPLAYDRDMQEDKEGLFDTVDTLNLCLDGMTAMIESIEFDRNRLAQAACDPASATTATDLADYLVRNGQPFREAHRAAGALVREAQKSGRALWDFSLEELVSLLGVDADPSIHESLDPKRSITRKDLPGATAPDQVRKAIARSRKLLEN
ncbi:MAG: argininosuccinate lyase [Planctomycetota bacterium]|nr:argininosuccinate lyase [Planctomycetota bacterium]